MTKMQSIEQRIRDTRSEDDFIDHVLLPLFADLGFEGPISLHHKGCPEDGKDIVFHEKNSLGLTYYAVVACVGKIHARSSRAQTHDSGHYAKILDQVEKCFMLPYADYNQKGDFQIGTVVVACSETITHDAMRLLREWEKNNHRRLFFLDAPSIACLRAKLRMQRAYASRQGKGSDRQKLNIKRRTVEARFCPKRRKAK